jgi:hypothetical protein
VTQAIKELHQKETQDQKEIDEAGALEVLRRCTDTVWKVRGVQEIRDPTHEEVQDYFTKALRETMKDERYKTPR